MQTTLPVRRLDGCIAVELPTEVDLDNAPDIGDQLVGLLNPDAPGLIVDMTGTSFCDSSGVNAVVRAYHRALEVGGWVRLVVTASSVHKVFQIVSVDQLIPIHASVGDAAAQAEVAASGVPKSVGGAGSAPADGAGR